MPALEKLLVPGALLLVIFQTFSSVSPKLSLVTPPEEPNRTLQASSDNNNGRGAQQQPQQQGNLRGDNGGSMTEVISSNSMLEVLSSNNLDMEDDDNTASTSTATTTASTTTTTKAKTTTTTSNPYKLPTKTPVNPYKLPTQAPKPQTSEAATTSDNHIDNNKDADDSDEGSHEEDDESSGSSSTNINDIMSSRHEFFSHLNGDDTAAAATTSAPKPIQAIAPPIKLSAQCEETCKELFAIDLGFDKDTDLDPNSDDFKQPWYSCKCGRSFCLVDKATLKKNKKPKLSLATCRWSPKAVEALVALVDGHNQCTPAKVQEFFLGQEWERYNFGDLFFGRGVWAGEAYHKNPKKAGSLMEAHYQANMAQLQLQKAQGKGKKKRGKRNYDVLYDVMKQTVEAMGNDKISFDLNINLPEANTLVIHLRLGDVIDSAVESVTELLKEQQYYFRQKDNKRGQCCDDPWVKPKNKPYRKPWNEYVKPLSYFTEQLQQHRHKNYTHVVIMGAAHKGQDLPDEFQTADRSCLYTHALQAYVQKALGSGVTVTQRLAQPPDSDVLYASLADGFVQSGGGYSELLANFQKRMAPIAKSAHFQQVRAKFLKRQQAVNGERFVFSKLVLPKDTHKPWAVNATAVALEQERKKAAALKKRPSNKRIKRLVKNKPVRRPMGLSTAGGTLVATSVRSSSTTTTKKKTT